MAQLNISTFGIKDIGPAVNFRVGVHDMHAKLA